MARFKRVKETAERPAVSDDFISDDPAQSVSQPSETPEEALRSLKGDMTGEAVDPSDTEEKAIPKKQKVYSSGILLDDNLQPVQAKKAGKGTLCFAASV